MITDEVYMYLLEKVKNKYIITKSQVNCRVLVCMHYSMKSILAMTYSCREISFKYPGSFKVLKTLEMIKGCIYGHWSCRMICPSSSSKEAQGCIGWIGGSHPMGRQAGELIIPPSPHASAFATYCPGKRCGWFWRTNNLDWSNLVSGYY